jgi:DNA-directed RNA polymerase subunit RPC12/RpoP
MGFPDRNKGRHILAVPKESVRLA